MEKKKIVIALGGNALGNDVEEQKEAVAKTAEVIVDLAQQGHHLIVTHGNGPQVGMIQNAMDNFDKDLAASKKVPLPTSVAMSQGKLPLHGSLSPHLPCSGCPQLLFLLLLLLS